MPNIMTRVTVRVQWERTLTEGGPREVEVELSPDSFQIPAFPSLPDLAQALEGHGIVEFTLRGRVEALRSGR